MIIRSMQNQVIELRPSEGRTIYWLPRFRQGETPTLVNQKRFQLIYEFPIMNRSEFVTGNEIIPPGVVFHGDVVPNIRQYLFMFYFWWSLTFQILHISNVRKELVIIGIISLCDFITYKDTWKAKFYNKFEFRKKQTVPSDKVILEIIRYHRYIVKTDILISHCYPLTGLQVCILIIYNRLYVPDTEIL